MRTYFSHKANFEDLYHENTSHVGYANLANPNLLI
jgi:hypothetical protein